MSLTPTSSSWTVEPWAADSPIAPSPDPACPKCSHPIPERAIECPRCGIVYDKFRGPAPRPEPKVWRDGSELLVMRGARLPNHRVRCNRPAGAHPSITLMWYPPSIDAIARLIPILYALLAVLLLKTAELVVPLCRRHHRIRTAGLWMGWLLLPAAVVLVALPFLIPPLTRPLGPTLVVVGLLLGLLGLIGLFIALEVVVATRIDAEHIWLKRVSRRYLETLPEAPPSRSSSRTWW